MYLSMNFSFPFCKSSFRGRKLLTVTREWSGGLTVGHGVGGEPEEDVETLPSSIPVEFRQRVVLNLISKTNLSRISKYWATVFT
jgi:hypothetical protein